jgi:TRAP-type mannitol/chloroaromatic compound transport system permease large subunit
MRHGGATDALAELIGPRNHPFLAMLVAGILLFVTGMFTGIAGVSVLAVGAFSAPLLLRASLSAPVAAGYIALLATLGMVAPPLNVPAMIMADGVNMPFAGFAGSLWVLSLPPALFALVTFTRRARLEATLQAQASQRDQREGHPAWLGVAVLATVIGFWGIIRYWPALVFDPSIPFVLFAGGLVGLCAVRTSAWGDVARATFSGAPLMLAAVLVSAGMLVQIMSLTGVRGWLVITAMSFHAPWIYPALSGIPLLGSVLTALGTSNSLGVPFAFAFIHQDMILNISALSAIAALSEFCPPTAISTALAAYIVGETRLWPIIRSALPTLAVLTVLSVLMLMFAPALAPYLR